MFFKTRGSFSVISHRRAKKSPLVLKNIVNHLIITREEISVKYTVTLAHKVTSIKQSPVLKGYIFLVPS